MDSTNGKEVVTYEYDSWGKILNINDETKVKIGTTNPYRYRGYRYDEETSLYYLQSRYYSPEWGRFINIDGIVGEKGDILSHKLFAYCYNNFVNLQDPSGFRPMDAAYIGYETPEMLSASLKFMNQNNNYKASKEQKSYLQYVSYGNKPKKTMVRKQQVLCMVLY